MEAGAWPRTGVEARALRRRRVRARHEASCDCASRGAAEIAGAAHRWLADGDEVPLLVHEHVLEARHTRQAAVH